MVAVWERVADWARRRLPLPLSPDGRMVVSPMVIVGGGAVLLTVTEMLLLVVVFPAPSLALAWRVWEPFVAVVVSQLML